MLNQNQSEEALSGNGASLQVPICILLKKSLSGQYSLMTEEETYKDVTLEKKLTLEEKSDSGCCERISLTCSEELGDITFGCPKQTGVIQRITVGTGGTGSFMRHLEVGEVTEEITDHSAYAYQLEFSDGTEKCTEAKLQVEEKSGTDCLDSWGPCETPPLRSLGTTSRILGRPTKKNSGRNGTRRFSCTSQESTSSTGLGQTSCSNLRESLRRFTRSLCPKRKSERKESASSDGHSLDSKDLEIISRKSSIDMLETEIFDSREESELISRPKGGWLNQSWLPRSSAVQSIEMKDHSNLSYQQRMLGSTQELCVKQVSVPSLALMENRTKMREEMMNQGWEEHLDDWSSYEERLPPILERSGEAHQEHADSSVKLSQYSLELPTIIQDGKVRMATAKNCHEEWGSSVDISSISSEMDTYSQLQTRLRMEKLMERIRMEDSQGSEEENSVQSSVSAKDSSGSPSTVYILAESVGKKSTEIAERLRVFQTSLEHRKHSLEFEKANLTEKLPRSFQSQQESINLMKCLKLLKANVESTGNYLISSPFAKMIKPHRPWRYQGRKMKKGYHGNKLVLQDLVRQNRGILNYVRTVFDQETEYSSESHIQSFEKVPRRISVNPLYLCKEKRFGWNVKETLLDHGLRMRSSQILSHYVPKSSFSFHYSAKNWRSIMGYQRRTIICDYTGIPGLGWKIMIPNLIRNSVWSPACAVNGADAVKYCAKSVQRGLGRAWRRENRLEWKRLIKRLYQESVKLEDLADKARKKRNEMYRFAVNKYGEFDVIRGFGKSGMFLDEIISKECVEFRAMDLASFASEAQKTSQGLKREQFIEHCNEAFKQIRHCSHEFFDNIPDLKASVTSGGEHLYINSTKVINNYQPLMYERFLLISRESPLYNYQEHLL